MKTPMQELIDKLYQLSDMHASDMYKAGMRDAAIIAKTMLEKEKDVIIDAWMDERFLYDKEWVKLCAEQYYNETFNTKER